MSGFKPGATGFKRGASSRAERNPGNRPLNVRVIVAPPQGYQNREARRAAAAKTPEDAGERTRYEKPRHNKQAAQERRARRRRGLALRTPENMDRAGYLGAELVPVDEVEEDDDE